jgi:hypothetical protein
LDAGEARAQQGQRCNMRLKMQAALSLQLDVSLAISMEPAAPDAILIQDAISQGAEACVLLLHGRPHLRQSLVTGLLRNPHHLDHDAILRIFSLVVFGFEPSQAVEYLKELKPAGYCGHVFKEGEYSYKCACNAILDRMDAFSCDRAF